MSNDIEAQVPKSLLVVLALSIQRELMAGFYRIHSSSMVSGSEELQSLTTNGNLKHGQLIQTEKQGHSHTCVPLQLIYRV